MIYLFLEMHWNSVAGKRFDLLCRPLAVEVSSFHELCWIYIHPKKTHPQGLSFVCLELIRIRFFFHLIFIRFIELRQFRAIFTTLFIKISRFITWLNLTWKIPRIANNIPNVLNDKRGIKWKRQMPCCDSSCSLFSTISMMSSCV